MRFRRIVLAVSVSTMLVAIAGVAGSAAAASSGACPASTKNFVAADNVDASFSTSADTTTYIFTSLDDENPVGGVPGLIKYCVYPNAGVPSGTTIVPLYDDWTVNRDPKKFSFVRPGGNKTNVPLDGTSNTMGTATWPTGKVPTNQTILLHINDPAECENLYGGSLLDVSGTCFVLPFAGPDCTHGDTSAAYNANPFDVLHCPKFALGFESNSTNEFGDRDTVAKSGASATLQVVFASYACGTSGHWDTGDCVSPNPPGIYTLPTGHNFTARIYDPSDLTTPLGTSTLLAANTPIPFRPSADPACTGPDAGKFVDPLAAAGSQCKNAKAFFLTFTFPSLTANLVSGSNYVWTVAFDTTHSGYSPIGESAACFTTLPGCGYDALNVGYMFYTGAPYAGVDPDPTEAYQSIGTGALEPLHSTTTWPDPGESGRPLGEITVP